MPRLCDCFYRPNLKIGTQPLRTHAPDCYNPPLIPLERDVGFRRESMMVRAASLLRYEYKDLVRNGFNCHQLQVAPFRITHSSKYGKLINIYFLHTLVAVVNADEWGRWHAAVLIGDRADTSCEFSSGAGEYNICRWLEQYIGQDHLAAIG